MIIYRTSDRIPVKIGEVTFLLSPLSFSQKARALAHTKIQSGEQTENAINAAREMLAMCVKGVEGLFNADGTAYEVELDLNGELSQESVDELMQVDQVDKLVSVCVKLAFQDIAKLQHEGVEVDLKNIRNVKKK